MRQKILAIYDSQPQYANKLAEYFSHKKENPYMIYGYENVDNIRQLQSQMGIDVLLAPADSDTDELPEDDVGKIFYLRSEGEEVNVGDSSILKYQNAENIFKVLYDYYIEHLLDEPVRLATMSSTKLIGLYSPVKRCCQTTFGLTLGQVLARRHKTLYLNFEGYSGFQHLMSKTFPKDLSDILYYFQDSKEKFPYKLNTAIEKQGDLDYIPPVLTPQFLQQVSSEEWLALIAQIMNHSDYEYIILDLSDYLQGLFEILRMCHRIFTLQKDDALAGAKISQYEQLLEMQEYGDILEKTRKKQEPLITRVPGNSQWFTMKEWVDYIEGIIREDLQIYDE